MPAIVREAAREARIGLELADGDFDSDRNHIYIRQQLGARSVISAKQERKTVMTHFENL
jgi:hypothetical protein